MTPQGTKIHLLGGQSALLHNNMSDPQVILGWFAAFVGAIGFGSFAVPIKGEAANSVDIDPLVMQSYKSLMCL